jgi:uncharacterized damage-inducible protein DinB
VSTASREFVALSDYTAWLRSGWRSHLLADPSSLGLDLGPYATGRLASVGDVIRHVFGAEIRYIDRLRGGEPRDVDHVAVDSVEALFDLGAEARGELDRFVADLSADDWERPVSFDIGDHRFDGPVWVILLHVLTHEIRHWMQLGVVLRMNGRPIGMQDLIAAPTDDGGFRPRDP